MFFQNLQSLRSIRSVQPIIQVSCFWSRWATGVVSTRWFFIIRSTASSSFYNSSPRGWFLFGEGSKKQFFTISYETLTSYNGPRLLGFQYSCRSNQPNPVININHLTDCCHVPFRPKGFSFQYDYIVHNFAVIVRIQIVL